MSGQALVASEAISQVVEVERILALLAHGEMELHGLLPGSSNYTFLVTVRDDSLQGLAVYKPQRGERPLWDFSPKARFACVSTLPT